MEHMNLDIPDRSEGAQLARVRRYIGRTQAAVSRDLNIPTPVISYLEHDAQRRYKSYLARHARAAVESAADAVHHDPAAMATIHQEVA